MLKYNETIGNITDYENDYVICIPYELPIEASPSWNPLVDRYYNRINDKNLVWKGKGFCIVSPNGKQIAMVNRPYARGYFMFQHIVECLQELHHVCIEHGFRKIAIPQFNIIDKHWSEFYKTTLEIFGDIEDMEIVVVKAKEQDELNIIDPDVEKMNYGKDRKSIDGNTQYKYY